MLATPVSERESAYRKSTIKCRTIGHRALEPDHATAPERQSAYRLLGVSRASGAMGKAIATNARKAMGRGGRESASGIVRHANVSSIGCKATLISTQMAMAGVGVGAPEVTMKRPAAAKAMSTKSTATNKLTKKRPAAAKAMSKPSAAMSKAMSRPSAAMSWFPSDRSDFIERQYAAGLTEDGEPLACCRVCGCCVMIDDRDFEDDTPKLSCFVCGLEISDDEVERRDARERNRERERERERARDGREGRQRMGGRGMRGGVAGL